MNMNNRKGFSLVEVLVVMSIMMVLGAVAGLSISIVNNSNVSKAAKNLDAMYNDARVTAMAKGEAKGTLTLKLENGKYYGYIGDPATLPASLDDWELISASAIKVSRDNEPASFNADSWNSPGTAIPDPSSYSITFTPAGSVKVAGTAGIHPYTNVFTFHNGKRGCIFYFYPETGKHGTKVFNLP